MKASELLYVQLTGTGPQIDGPNGAGTAFQSSYLAFLGGAFAQRELIPVSDTGYVRTVGKWQDDGSQTGSLEPKGVHYTRSIFFFVPREAGDPEAVEIINGQLV